MTTEKIPNPERERNERWVRSEVEIEAFVEQLDPEIQNEVEAIIRRQNEQRRIRAETHPPHRANFHPRNAFVDAGRTTYHYSLAGTYGETIPLLIREARWHEEYFDSVGGDRERVESPARFSDGHAGLVSSVVILSFARLEAMANAALHRLMQSDDFVARLYLNHERSILKAFDEFIPFRLGQPGGLGTLEKFQAMLVTLGKDPFTKGAEPYSAVRLIQKLRNALVHPMPQVFESEGHFDQEWEHTGGERMFDSDAFRGYEHNFETNPIYSSDVTDDWQTGWEAPVFPYFSSSFAEWVFLTCDELAKEAFERLGFRVSDDIWAEVWEQSADGT